MGVFPGTGDCKLAYYGLPHTRGGVSLRIRLVCVSSESSPHTWGCFSNRCQVSLYSHVFPTHVGVFLIQEVWRRTMVCLPHTRGGVSKHIRFDFCRWRSSPHTWGCFPRLGRRHRPRFVFPTHVGVFPRCHRVRTRRPGLPHTRGGVSD